MARRDEVNSILTEMQMPVRKNLEQRARHLIDDTYPVSHEPRVIKAIRTLTQQVENHADYQHLLQALHNVELIVTHERAERAAVVAQAEELLTELNKIGMDNRPVIAHQMALVHDMALEAQKNVAHVTTNDLRHHIMLLASLHRSLLVPD